MKQSKKARAPHRAPKTLRHDHYGYLHGYESNEQERLVRQAKFFENRIYKDVSWPEGSVDILEPGCGVGAQSEILLRRFPTCRLTSVDRSPEQLAKAKKQLKDAITSKRVKLLQAEGKDLPFKDSSFDGAFICFVLEHVPQPVEMLSEIRRVLRPGAYLYCTEVLNSSFFFHPYAPATLKYCFAFNDHQWNLGGDPFCGAKLGNHLTDAGFQSVDTRVLSFLLDRRTPKTRNAYFEDYFEMLHSASKTLIEAGLIEASLVTEMEKEWKHAMKDPNAVLFQSLVQARGTVL